MNSLKGVREDEIKSVFLERWEDKIHLVIHTQQLHITYALEH